eukprot:CAMPEP_0118974644 /NCGR_PEP_ID=MMETSP1173-20130426/12567_1 /TAXON_ID=1034831 /ORGANISM="Rhizochromulina marina cf, Strain CCMP1243" /LENGTH=429 /DNA_ID=CAMNT_0006924421 /DNA_START=60 /DNA_END=1349 /DNA_ORIENTATION=+
MFRSSAPAAPSPAAKRGKKIMRQSTTRSETVISHVDLISTYNQRLSSIIDNEKLKDVRKRDLEDELYKEKLSQADFIANVSYGHELQQIFDRYDKDHTEISEAMFEEDYDVLGEHEESETSTKLLEIEAIMLKAQFDAATARVEALESQLGGMKVRLEGVKSESGSQAEQAADAKKKRSESQKKYDDLHKTRPSLQRTRKADKEIAKLVAEAQRLREDHNALMKKLHAQEGAEISVIESEFQTKLAEQDEALKAEFSGDELDTIDKHMKHQKTLKEQQRVVEDKMKKEMEAQELQLRSTIKKLKISKAKSSSATDDMRRRKVDFISERDVFKAQLKHAQAVNKEKEDRGSLLQQEVTELQTELKALQVRISKSDAAYKMTAKKYNLVVEQNKKMTAAVEAYNGLVTRAETELEFSPPSKRIRLHKQGSI